MAAQIGLSCRFPIYSRLSRLMLLPLSSLPFRTKLHNSISFGLLISKSGVRQTIHVYTQRQFATATSKWPSYDNLYTGRPKCPPHEREYTSFRIQNIRPDINHHHPKVPGNKILFNHPVTKRTSNTRSLREKLYGSKRVINERNPVENSKLRFADGKTKEENKKETRHAERKIK